MRATRAQKTIQGFYWRDDESFIALIIGLSLVMVYPAVRQELK